MADIRSMTFDAAELRRLVAERHRTVEDFRNRHTDKAVGQLRFAAGRAESELFQYLVAHAEEITDSLARLDEAERLLGVWLDYHYSRQSTGVIAGESERFLDGK